MTVHRYAVIDADGTKINTITADDALIASGWYPGYGAALIDEGENPADPPKALPVLKPLTWVVLPKLDVPLANGDKIDLKAAVAKVGK